jgi:CheY-like chemotaxis protein
VEPSGHDRSLPARSSRTIGVDRSPARRWAFINFDERHVAAVATPPRCDDAPRRAMGAACSPRKQGNDAGTAGAYISYEMRNSNADRLTDLAILVVDDDCDVRELTLTVLAGAGATVESASSACEALELLATKRFDVLVCDIAMPVIDGVSLIRALRSMRIASSGVAALALTSFCTQQDRQRVLEAGFDRHLGKTSDPETLVQTVAELAGRLVRKAS